MTGMMNFAIVLAIVDFAVVAGASHGSSEFGQSGVVTPLVAFLTDVLKP